jgi:hypothetical protein
MTKTFLATLSSVAALLLAPGAHAARVVDTGTPAGNGLSLDFDSEDWYAAQVRFAQASTVDAIAGHLLGGTPGETFDISLFSADGTPGLGTLVYTGTATYGGDGWNGLSGLTGWRVAAGTYWIEFEIQADDTLNSALSDAPVLDVGAPNPVATTAFTSDGGTPYSYTTTPLSFGLQVDATAVSAVPWPASAPLMLAGLALLAMRNLARRRR